MVPFKEVFLGNEKRVRSCDVGTEMYEGGGKHNDLELVGSHLGITRFRDVGQFLVGSYFKEEAITYAWHYITQVLCLPVSRSRHGV